MTSRKGWRRGHSTEVGLEPPWIFTGVGRAPNPGPHPERWEKLSPLSFANPRLLLHHSWLVDLGSGLRARG